MTDKAPNFEPDLFDLYEQAAQSPVMQAKFLAALYRDNGGEGETITLGEDFSAAGAIARAFVDLDPRHRAICVDCDETPLARLQEKTGGDERIKIRCANVMDIDDPVDTIAVLNFSIGELRTRAELIAYLTHARSRLRHKPGAPGLFVLDIYGGENALSCGESDIELRDGVQYVWEQRDADPLTGRVVNAMRFVFADGRTIRDAFVYRWRLWAVPELRDALAEAGFGDVSIYDRLGDAIDSDGDLHPAPIKSGDELDDNFVVCLAARA